MEPTTPQAATTTPSSPPSETITPPVSPPETPPIIPPAVPPSVPPPVTPNPAPGGGAPSSATPWVFVAPFLIVAALAAGAYYYYVSTLSKAPIEPITEVKESAPAGFIAPTAGETLPLRTAYQVRWTPVALQENQVAQLWFMLPDGRGYYIALDSEINPASGSFTLPQNGTFWNYLEVGKQATIVLKVGHYEKQSPGVAGFVVDTEYRSPSITIGNWTSPQTQAAPAATSTTQAAPGTKQYKDPHSGLSFRYATEFSLLTNSTGFQLSTWPSSYRLDDPNAAVVVFVVRTVANGKAPITPGMAKTTFLGKEAYSGIKDDCYKEPVPGETAVMECYMKTLEIALPGKVVAIGYGVMASRPDASYHASAQQDIKATFQAYSAAFEAILKSVSF